MSAKKIRTFKDLDKSQFPKSPKKKRGGKLPPPPPQPVEEAMRKEPDETTLFCNAMQDVKPLDGERKSRTAPICDAPSETAPPKTRADDDHEVKKRLMDLVSGKLEFSLEYSEEFIQGHVKGLDLKLLGRLKAGAYSPEAHLDLHGMTLEQAYDNMVDFIRRHYLEGHRTVLLIPGRGRNSPEGRSILRQAVQTWLTRDPFKRVVLAFCTARPQHGGAGALYVLLRKHRKAEGKIVWDRVPANIESFE
ncbi:DNA mismatch repair protein MutS [Oceanidesulfovibrio indonesiensis]|uniref:DNA mismatch repair protein MutS n=1 Tax=Oceanidesulfovibrio indonesiensis TaxID=54767 RepID=A0A7M3MFB6_9BACT|nr:Smr/MutS family protein [Oceanidesulfovibrio indonesiensis]TVM17349.1 DNA mismatch repair protein MutS [Oceanidesulfovibrio indonesiensis]